MSYRKNWLRHMLAGYDAFNDELVRDFWPSTKENLWDSSKTVHHRWWKLFYVYAICVFAHVSLPLAIVVPFIMLFGKGWSWQWWLISVGVATAIGLVGALIHTTEMHGRVLAVDKGNKVNVKRGRQS